MCILAFFDNIQSHPHLDSYLSEIYKKNLYKKFIKRQQNKGKGPVSG